MKRVMSGDETKMFNDLLWLASYYGKADPCGALLIRNAAWMLANGKCLRCKMEYQRGHAAGYKAGVKEWETADRT